jgi:hypothetical protein
MEVIILTIILCFYILYNEIHKRKIKNEKKEYTIPENFYNNLKEFIHLMDYTLESIKQKQENINKIYIKLQELKQELDQKKNNTKKSKKSVKINHNETQQTKNEIQDQESEDNVQSSFINKILEEIDNDKIEFSFRNENNNNKIKSDDLLFLKNQNIDESQKSVFQKMGIMFRKFFNIPEIPLNVAFKNENAQSKNIISSQERIKPISLEEYEYQLNSSSSQNLSQTKEWKNKNTLNEGESELENQTMNIYQNQNINPKEILINESKKLFAEIKTKEEKIRFINKLIDFGFSEEEITEITNLPKGEILLIYKLKTKKG